GAPWTRPSLVVMREKFRLIGRHIDADRAIALASFAAEAQVQRPLDVLILPAATDHLPLGHFPEQVRPAARGMFFFTCHPEAGAHHATLVVPAFAHTDATQAGARQTPVIFRTMKV